jgi:hypothetical protein
VTLVAAVWPGNHPWHLRHLQRIVARNCGGCADTTACGAHSLLYDLKALQHLAFVKEDEDRTSRMWTEEWHVTPPQR